MKNVHRISLLFLLFSGVGLNLALQANSAFSQTPDIQKETIENQEECCCNQENHEMMGNNDQMGINHEMMRSENHANHEIMMGENGQKCESHEMMDNNHQMGENHDNHHNNQQPQPKN